MARAMHGSEAQFYATPQHFMSGTLLQHCRRGHSQRLDTRPSCDIPGLLS